MTEDETFFYTELTGFDITTIYSRGDFLSWEMLGKWNAPILRNAAQTNNTSLINVCYKYLGNFCLSQVGELSDWRRTGVRS